MLFNDIDVKCNEKTPCNLLFIVTFYLLNQFGIICHSDNSYFPCFSAKSRYILSLFDVIVKYLSYEQCLNKAIQDNIVGINDFRIYNYVDVFSC